MTRVAIVYHPIYAKHITPLGHPESRERYLVVEKALRKEKLVFDWVLARSATQEELLLCHSQEYINKVLEETGVCVSIAELSTGDVTICSDSFEVASYAVGGVLTACDLVFTKRVQNAFCPTRPPGHHATENRGMGFCIFNNVACGARYVQKRYGVKRVLIVDWDVHHGNGTQDIFEQDSSVLYFSTHQKGLYPGTGDEKDRGSGSAVGTKVNHPILPGKKSREEVIHVFEKELALFLERYPPECIFISCGFDAHEHDPLGKFSLTTDDFGHLTALMVGYAKKYCEGRLISVLEGGYNLEVLGECAARHVEMLAK